MVKCAALIVVVVVVTRFNMFSTCFSTVIEELHKYKHENQIDASAFLDRNLKMVAFNFARYSNHPPFLKMMATIFELPREKDMFIDKIRDIIAEHNYKDVKSYRIIYMTHY